MAALRDKATLRQEIVKVSSWKISAGFIGHISFLLQLRNSPSLLNETIGGGSQLARQSKTLVVALCLLLASFEISAQPIESLAGTMPRSGDYGEVLAAMDAIGADATSLTLFWDDLVKDGVYSADPDWPAIAEAVYPPYDIRIQLTFAVIDTLADRRPPELQSLAWDDPRVVRSFTVMVEEALTRMPNVDIVSIAVGNEVDGHLTRDKVNEYARFFEQARSTLQNIRRNVPITVKVTWPGLRDHPEFRALARRGDALSITWYPMDANFHFHAPDEALEELSAMAAMASGPWELSEVGYPSNGCGASSEGTQAIFHEGLISVSATYPELTLVQRVWSHDISPAEVSIYSEYYMTKAACFRAFLGSLGLRTARDRAKPAFNVLTAR